MGADAEAGADADAAGAADMEAAGEEQQGDVHVSSRVDSFCRQRNRHEQRSLIESLLEAADQVAFHLHDVDQVAIHVQVDDVDQLVRLHVHVVYVYLVTSQCQPAWNKLHRRIRTQLMHVRGLVVNAQKVLHRLNRVAK